MASAILYEPKQQTFRDPAFKEKLQLLRQVVEEKAEIVREGELEKRRVATAHSVG
jgi:hypothetical protein